ncbi:MAG: ECF RNA polymerase sigma factor SigW [Phycisphaerae bacterium]|nr:ECF RNA polymerase sigma factor SigW [Phycisphaerae bacterium]
MDQQVGQPIPPPPEEALFAGTNPQRRAALGELMARFGPRLYALARHLVRSPELAEELVQECFVRLWQRAIHPPPQAGPVLKVYGYLRRVLVNLTYHQHRPDAAAGWATDAADPLADHADDGPAPADLLIRAESAGRAMEAMDRLPDDQRTVLALRVLEGRSYQQLADELGWPIGTVMSRLHRARSALAEMLEESEPKLRLRRPS